MEPPWRVIRPAPELDPDDRADLARIAEDWGRKQRELFEQDEELQDYIRGDPAGAQQAISDWLAAARAAGLLPPAAEPN